MNTNLPQKCEIGFFSKIKSFFKKFFQKNTLVIDNKSYIDKTYMDNSNCGNSIFEMRKASENAKIKEDILEMIRKNPDVVEKLSEEKLEKLDKICDDRIIENDKKIAQLKSQYERLQQKLA